MPMHVSISKDFGCFSYGETMTYNPNCNLQLAVYNLHVLSGQRHSAAPYVFKPDKTLLLVF